MLKPSLRRLARRAGYEVVRTERQLREAERYRLLVERAAMLAQETVAADLPAAPGRGALLSELAGTDPLEALLLLRNLHLSLESGGDVCELGVAQGTTSALIANELKHHAPDRTLWLYDSFEGLPAPGEKDHLISDPLSLGDIDAYAGRFREPRSSVEQRLRSVGWPASKTRIIQGYFSEAVSEEDLPSQISFAYIDFDFYQPIKDGLKLLSARSPSGTRLMVDDYGEFSSGAKTAVDEFLSEADDTWELTAGPHYCDPFVLLRRS